MGDITIFCQNSLNLNEILIAIVRRKVEPKYSTTNF